MAEGISPGNQHAGGYVFTTGQAGFGIPSPSGDSGHLSASKSYLYDHGFLLGQPTSQRDVAESRRKQNRISQRNYRKNIRDRLEELERANQEEIGRETESEESTQMFSAAGKTSTKSGQGYPPVNSIDQNPPCNTLYVGNLPMDASEAEFKILVARQPGYRRLVWRNKQNGPMCFVEFDDVAYATRALGQLYGYQMSNSTKGGIRLSYSKNPLGVRSGQTAGSSLNTTSQVAVGAEPRIIQCICGKSGSADYLLQCEQCGTWQHIACYHKPEKEDWEVHTCVQCAPRQRTQQARPSPSRAPTSEGGLTWVVGGTPAELRSKENMTIVRKKAMASFLCLGPEKRRESSISVNPPLSVPVEARQAPDPTIENANISTSEGEEPTDATLDDNAKIEALKKAKEQKSARDTSVVDRRRSRSRSRSEPVVSSSLEREKKSELALALSAGAGAVAYTSPGKWFSGAAFAKRRRNRSRSRSRSASTASSPGSRGRRRSFTRNAKGKNREDDATVDQHDLYAAPYDHYEYRPDQHRHGSNLPSRSRSRESRSEKWEQAAKAAVVAGAVDAFRNRKGKSLWTGAKGQRVGNAALGATGTDSLIDRNLKRQKRHIAESAVGGLLATRLANDSRSRSRSWSRTRGRAVSRSPSRSPNLRSALIYGRSRSRSRSRSRQTSRHSSGRSISHDRKKLPEWFQWDSISGPKLDLDENDHDSDDNYVVDMSSVGSSSASDLSVLYGDTFFGRYPMKIFDDTQAVEMDRQSEHRVSVTVPTHNREEEENMHSSGCRASDQIKADTTSDKGGSKGPTNISVMRRSDDHESQSGEPMNSEQITSLTECSLVEDESSRVALNTEIIRHDVNTHKPVRPEFIPFLDPDDSPHILPEAAKILDDDWKQVQMLLPETWMWDVEYDNTHTETGGHHSSWTCTPLEVDVPKTYPLTIANAPVVLPVEHHWPPLGGVTPPPDPRPSKPIDSRAKIALAVARDIFLTFEGSVGFYLLISGLLQIIVPDDFDTTWASSHLPHKYGGLKVCYIQQNMEPTMLPAKTETMKAKPSLSSPSSSMSHIFRPSRSTNTALQPNLKLNDFIEARPKSNHKKDKYSGRIGLKVTKDGDSFLVMSTHVITEAILAKSHREAIFGRSHERFEKLKGDWDEHAEIWAGNEKIGTIHRKFDTEAEIYPNGFHHDMTLIKPPTPAAVKDIASPIANLGWLNRLTWASLRQQSSTVRILAPTEDHRAAKSLKCSRPSDILVVGEGIFLNQKAAAGGSKNLKDHDMSTWKDLVSKALLYRVYPDFDPPNGYSGIALYANGVREDGTEGPGIVGFQSFVQRSGHVQNFDMEGSALERRLQLGRVAFYGAFEVPAEAKQYSIV